MDEDITEKEALLFLLLWRHCGGEKRKNERKKPRFWFRDIFVKGINMEKTLTSAGPEKMRWKTLF